MSHNIPTGETNLPALLKNMKPQLNEGDYVFCIVGNDFNLSAARVIYHFREKEGITIILEKSIADSLQLTYNIVTAWITLTVHSSLEAAGLTAAFSKALADENISCNVIAAYYHDHIFVDKEKEGKTMEVLNTLSAKYS